jgi:glycosyltransferase involved in cell wall biosynthesis
MAITQELTPPGSFTAAPPEVPARTLVLLIAPYGARGGGMGRMMDYLAEAQPAGFRMERVESHGGGHWVTSAWFMLLAAHHIVRAAVGRPGAIVHVNVAERGSVAREGGLLLLARALGLRAVLHLHAAELIEVHDRLPRLARYLVGVPFRAATVCIVLGVLWRDFLRDTLGVPEARIELLRNGVPRPVLRRFPAPSRCFNVVFVGNLQPRKGLHDLLHALANPALRGFDWCLTVAGGGDSAGLRRLAAALGVQRRVSFCGWLDHDSALFVLTQASAVALPSYAEGLPLVLLEAASLGLPIVTTPVGAVGEVFTDGETALLVPPGDRAALTAALVLLMAEPSCAPRLGAQARELHAKTLTLNHFVIGLDAIYRRHCQAPARALATQ